MRPIPRASALGPCGSPPTPSSQARQGVRPLLPPTPHSLQSWLGSVKSRARQGGGGDVSAGTQAPLVRSDGPPPRLPKSTHPPLYPLLGAFWVAALHRGRRSSSLEPRACLRGAGGGGGRTDSLGPLPQGRWGSPHTHGRWHPVGPPRFGERKPQPRGAWPELAEMRSVCGDPLAPRPGGDV